MIKRLSKYLPTHIIQEVFDALKTEGDSRLVGGCVREILRNKKPKDIDIATQVTPDKVQELLWRANFKCIPTGIKYGTITAIKDCYTFEITTLRSDIETDGRHAEVAFTNDWEEDAKRRDFTVNAMSMDLEGEVFDYFGGTADLKQHVIRFVGNPEERIQEDFLRILRYFRFYGYFEKESIDPESLDACIKFKDKINLLSGERLRAEFFKILQIKYAQNSLRLMRDAGVLDALLECNTLSAILELQFSTNYLANFTAILARTHYPKANLDYLLEKLKLSNAEKKIIKTILLHMHNVHLETRVEHIKLIYTFGYDVYKTYVAFRNTLEGSNIKALQTFIMPIFPITGNDLKKLHFEGKEIGVKMKYLEQIWIDANFKVSKANLVKKLR